MQEVIERSWLKQEFSREGGGAEVGAIVIFAGQTQKTVP